MKTKTLIPIVLATVLAMALFSGCGSRQESSTTTSAATAGTTTATSVTTTETTTTVAEEPYTSITVVKVPYFFLDGGISFVDENGGSIDMPDDISEWFTNAEFEGAYNDGERTNFERDESVKKEVYSLEDQILSKGSSVLFVFIVDGVKYQISVGSDTKLYKKKTASTACSPIRQTEWR